MRRLFVLILALTLCLSLCACGGESADTPTTAPTTASTTVPTTTHTTEPTEAPVFPYQFLIDGEWKDINSDATLVFYQDGTGIRSGSGIEWKVVGNFLYITGIANGYTTEYNIVEKNNITRIVSKDGKTVFVGESEYNTVYENERPVATITCHDGSVVKLTARELHQLEKDNSGVFKQLYYCTDITFIGTIKEISTEVYETMLWTKTDIILFEEGWSLTLLHGEYTDLLLTLSPGDRLEVSSQIYSVSNADKIDIRGCYASGGWNAKSLENTIIAIVEEEG